MPRVDATYRRHAAAAAVLRMVQHDRPDAVRQLRDRLSGVNPVDQNNLNPSVEALLVIAAWCGELNLACEAIQNEAQNLGLFGGLTPANNDPDAQGDPESIYGIRWIVGESERKFLKRARDEFRRRRQEHIDQLGVLFQSADINPKHVEWFVRFQVYGEDYGAIVDSANTDRPYVKKAIRNIAALLQLSLRHSAPGRRPGTGGRPNRPAALIVRQKSRR